MQVKFQSMVNVEISNFNPFYVYLFVFSLPLHYSELFSTTSNLFIVSMTYFLLFSLLHRRSETNTLLIFLSGTHLGIDDKADFDFDYSPI